jgi:UDP-N-acetylmuramoyl-tripeptide--D-alanyl-D-alanine ligase
VTSDARPGASAVLGRSLMLSELAQAARGRLIGADLAVEAVGTDTRSLTPGDLFLALRGPRFDAHDFLDEAAARGAVAALVDRPVTVNLPVVVVDDTRAALGRWAAWWRDRFTGPVAAVTGSNGKTTVKEMLAHILTARGEGVVTRGNLNNEIGVPLTLLRLGPRHRFAVIEMGASRAGDIEYLAGIARPDVAAVTNAAPAHLAGFGSIEGVARAKGEMFSSLRDAGVAVINADDPCSTLWRAMAGSHRIVTFGLDRQADVRAQAIRRDFPAISFELVTPLGSRGVSLGIPGGHNVMNALAAAALAHALGASLDEIARGLSAMPGVDRRLQLKRGFGGAWVLDDTYNANPGSVRAALQVISEIEGGAHRILVLGDMGELGGCSVALHEGIGREARESGVDQLLVLGELAIHAAKSFGTGARRFDSHEELVETLRKEIASKKAGHRVIILVKGSRSMRMERVADALLAVDAPAGASAPWDSVPGVKTPGRRYEG